MSERILLVCPTRDNPVDAELAYQSMLKTSSMADMVICIDEDQQDAYRAFREFPRMHVSVGSRGRLTAAWNRGVAEHMDYSAFGVFVDDARLQTDCWDEFALSELARFPKRLGVVSAHHSIGNYVNFPVVSREWIDVLGWFMCPQTLHYCGDTVLELLGEATQITYARPDQFSIEHLHKRNDIGVVSEKFYSDCAQFLYWTVNERRPLVEKLRRVIHE